MIIKKFIVLINEFMASQLIDFSIKTISFHVYLQEIKINQFDFNP